MFYFIVQMDIISKTWWKFEKCHLLQRAWLFVRSNSTIGNGTISQYEDLTNQKNKSSAASKTTVHVWTTRQWSNHKLRNQWTWTMGQLVDHFRYVVSLLQTSLYGDGLVEDYGRHIPGPRQGMSHDHGRSGHVGGILHYQQWCSYPPPVLHVRYLGLLSRLAGVLSWPTSIICTMGFWVFGKIALQGRCFTGHWQKSPRSLRMAWWHTVPRGYKFYVTDWLM